MYKEVLYNGGVSMALNINRLRKHNKKYRLYQVGIQSNSNALEHIRKNRKVVEEVGISSGYAMPSNKLFIAKGEIKTKRKPGRIDETARLLREGKLVIDVINGEVVIINKD